MKTLRDRLADVVEVRHPDSSQKAMAIAVVTLCDHVDKLEARIAELEWEIERTRDEIEGLR